ncbi:hypothetical protein DL96DRAFT_1597169 [Flagelloscypha sp. PMI_526]|nr:hypothetical protein DL96DRAFT_1597169 [Flagelloscypha sp. PMI_526]
MGVRKQPSSFWCCHENIAGYMATHLTLLICSYLPQSSLPLVALVSSSFNAAAISRLYNSLFFGHRHAKRYLMEATSFSSVVGRPGLGVHVRHIDIRAVPLLKTSHHPRFLRDCNTAISLAKNLVSFKCTPRNVLAPLLLPLIGNQKNLGSLRIYAGLTTVQSNLLVSKISNLHELSLDAASWNILDRLSEWTGTLRASLQSLTLYGCQDLNMPLIESVLKEIPNLRALHCTGAPRVDQTSLLLLLSSSLPRLESLALTVTENAKSLDPFESASLYHLRCLAVDLVCADSPGPGFTALKSTLKFLQNAPLQSFSIRLPDAQIRLGHLAVKDYLLKYFALSLRRIAAIDCSLENDTLYAIFHGCPNLERVELDVPTRHLDNFITYLSCNGNVHTLIDLEGHNTHGERLALSAPSVRWLFGAVNSLKTIVSDARVWTRNVKSSQEPTFERKPPIGGGNHWFIPPSAYFNMRP